MAQDDVIMDPDKCYWVERENQKQTGLEIEKYLNECFDRERVLKTYRDRRFNPSYYGVITIRGIAPEKKVDLQAKVGKEK